MTNVPRNEMIEIRLVGGDIAPAHVRAGDLAMLLEAAEGLVEAAVLARHDELTKDDVVLALTAVEQGSLALRFSSPIAPVLVSEFERTADLIEQQRYDLVPSGVTQAIRRLATFTRKYHCSAELRTSNNDLARAIVGPSLVIPVAPRLEMPTTIYGWVQEAGGKTPNVHIDTIQGQRVVCAGSRAQVKQLAERLYDMVGVEGRARVDAVTNSIVEFYIDSILPYQATPIDEAMRELRQAAGKYFEGIDANEYVRSLRADVSEV